MDSDKLSNFIGIITFLSLLGYILRFFSNNTETEVISAQGLEILEDPGKKEKLRTAVEEYHKTGDWAQTKLNSII